MAPDVALSYSRSFPAVPESAFDQLLPFDLTQLFDTRYAAIPPIKAVREQVGTWGTPGQTRTIALADGGTMREELLEVVRPIRFSYRISDLTGPLKLLATSLDGEWTFRPAGTGVRVTWSWTIRPAGRLGSLAMPLFARMWRGYARRSFENIEKLLVE